MLQSKAQETISADIKARAQGGPCSLFMNSCCRCVLNLGISCPRTTAMLANFNLLSSGFCLCFVLSTCLNVCIGYQEFQIKQTDQFAEHHESKVQYSQRGVSLYVSQLEVGVDMMKESS